MKLHQVLLADTPPQPWRNGGGSTRVLLTWPSAERWQLRLSVAEIAADGPFSPFPGVQRWFAVISGAGVRLDLPEGPASLRPGSEPLHFAGEAAPGCTLLDGPTQDLNLMSLRGAGSARMQAALPGSTLAGGPAWRGLYAADAAQVDLGPGVQALAAGTLLWCDAASDVPWTLHQAGRAWWLTLENP